MQGKNTTISTFDQPFETVTSFTQNLKNREVDKYIKKFTALKFTLLMSFAQLNQFRSLRDTSNHLDDEQLAETIALTSISGSKYDCYCYQGIRFAGCLKASALVETVEEYPVKPEGKIIKIVTNDFALSAQKIGDIYRNRWQIEIFFKWIKQHLFIKHFYGTGEQAVELQLYIALTTYCLLALLKQKTGYQGSLLNLKRAISVSLYEPFPSFVRKLYGKVKRQSRGRRKIDYELIYQETLRQVISGEADHLNDLTYDPVIL